MTLHFPTRAERPGKLPHAASLHAAPKPAFLNEVDVLKRLFGRVVAEYAEFLFYAWDDEREEVVGVGHAIPAAWGGDTTRSGSARTSSRSLRNRLVTTGTVTEWEEWTEMALPESGTYVVPGALAPITIDRERNEGTYVEPNVWMVHPGD